MLCYKLQHKFFKLGEYSLFFKAILSFTNHFWAYTTWRIKKKEKEIWHISYSMGAE